MKERGGEGEERGGKEGVSGGKLQYIWAGKR